jgi:hypothetical protein
MFFHKKPPHDPACLAVHVCATVLLLLTTLASLVGVVMAHYRAADNSVVFGTMTASLALIAFAVTAHFFMKQCRNCLKECDVCEVPMIAAKKKK